MDWGRAKNILIISFLLLNLFLAQRLSETLHTNNISAQSDKISDQQLSTQLKTAGIKISFVRDPDVVSLTPIIVKSDTLPNGWKPDENGFYFKIVTDLKQIPYYKDFKLSSTSGSQKLYYQITNKKPIFDAKLRINLQNNLVSLIHYQEIAKASSLSILSFNNILNRLVNSEIIPKKSTITGATLGYRTRSSSDNADEFYLIPYWRFTFNNNKSYYVGAVSNNLSEDIELEKEARL